MIVESLPKNSLQQQHYKEEGDVLSSQQPTFVASFMASHGNNDKCVRNNVALTSESSCSISSDQEVVNNEDDNNSNPQSSQSNLTSHSVLNGKANESLDLLIHYPPCNLKYNSKSNDQGIKKYETGNQRCIN